MSEWKQGAAARRDARRARDEQRQRATPKRKDTKTWCRGKVGVKHEPECKRYSDVKYRNRWMPEHWRVLVCKRCGKELAMFYGRTRDKTPPWVTF